MVSKGLSNAVGMLLSTVPGLLFAQPAHHIEFSTPPAVVVPGSSFPLSIQAIGFDQLPLTNWAASLRLAVTLPGEPKPIISEIYPFGGVIEIANPGSEAVDVSGWELQALAEYGATPNTRLRIPPQTVLPARSVMTWSDRGVPPGAFPAFVSSKPLASSYGLEVVRLFNAEAILVDEVFLSPYSTAAYEALWEGLGLSSCPTNLSHTRRGDVNRFRIDDWVTATPTPGIVNSGLVLPWTNTDSSTLALPAVVQVSNGVWTGVASVPAARPGRAWFKADNNAGVSGQSAPFTILPAPSLSFEVPLAVLKASESQAGLAGSVTLMIPMPLTNDIQVALRVSAPAEFTVPPQVIIPAGNGSVSFPVTNFDDGVSDGTAVVTLTATADGFAPASATLLNEDDEQGSLYVFIPGPLREGSGVRAGAGQVFLTNSAAHDVLVQLDSDRLLEVPGTATILAGRSSASFPIGVLDDEFVNPYPVAAAVRAHTSAWPPGVGTVSLLDDEDSTFTLSVPSRITEGTAANGQLRVGTMRLADTAFDFTSSDPRLLLPAQVILPAGELTVDVPLQATNDLLINGHSGVVVCAPTAGVPTVCASVQVLDDELNLRMIYLGNIPPAVLSGVPFPFSPVLVNDYGQVQLTNTSGDLTLLVSSNVASLAQGSSPIQFTNGLSTNSLVIEGEALGVQLHLSAAGMQTNTPRFDVLRGGELAMPIGDAVWDSHSSRFLVAEPARTNAPARLSEFDPVSRAWGRSMDLPRAVQRVAISDDGKVAWLASDGVTMQRINLDGWQFDQEYRVEPATTNANALDLFVVPGQSELVVAVTVSNRTRVSLALYDHGVPFTNRTTLPGSSAVCLIPGRTASEAFCQGFGWLSRFNVISNGVTLDRSIQVSSSSAEFPNLTLSNSKLYRGTGEVFFPDTLARDVPFGGYAIYRQLGMPCSDRNTVLFIEYYNTLNAYDQATRQSLTSHALPALSGTARRLLRFGGRGLATVSPAGLALFETPLLSTNLPDLVLTARAPSMVVLSPSNMIGARFSWEFSVTNQGNAPALGVRLTIDSGQVFRFGSLGPGDGASVSVENYAGSAAVLKATATASSAIPDMNPSDNALTVVTRIQEQDLPSSSQLVFGMTHLIGSPQGDRLYVAVAKSAGDLVDGVAVVDPFKGSMEKFLPMNGSPQRLAISSDGSRLYVLEGTDCLVRWRLAPPAEELRVTLTNEAIIDFVPVPGSIESVVVSTTARLVAFDGDLPRPVTFESPISTRYLGYAGEALWTAEPGRLRRFNLDATGLVAGTNLSYSVPSGYYAFVTDGRNLIFPGGIYDTLAGTNYPRWIGDRFCADTNTGCLFTGVGPRLRSFSLAGYQLQAEQWLPQAGADFFSDVVRWGPDGIALRSGSQLLMVRSPLVPSGSVLDVGVAVAPPLRGLRLETLDWSVVVTNHSGVTSPRTVLYVEWGEMRDLEILGPYSWHAYSSLVYEVGDLPAHGSAVIGLRGWSYGSSLTVSANVLTAGPDLNTTNNSSSVYLPLYYRTVDLSVASASMPSRVQTGEDFIASFVISNLGPEAVQACSLSLSRSAGLRFLGVVGNAYPTNEYGVTLPGLAPGESRAADLRYRAVGAGVLPLMANVGAPIDDPVLTNNKAGAFVYAVPANTNLLLTRMVLPSRPILAWDTSRGEILAVFPEDSWSLFVLDPLTLAPLRWVPMPTLPEFIAPCNNGRHAWVSLAGQGAARVDLTTMTIDSQFNYSSGSCSVFGVAAPPGVSNVLVVALDPDWGGNYQTRVYADGIARPVSYGYLPRWLLFTPDGRLFLSGSGSIRQVSVTPTGLSEVRNLDSVALDTTVAALSYSANRLFQWGGRVANLSTLEVDDRFRYQYPLVADSETQVAYLASGTWGGARASLTCLDASSLDPQWRIMPDIQHLQLSSIIAMGTNGCVVVGDEVWLARPAKLGTRAVDLALTMSGVPATAELGVPFPIQLSVTNDSNWAAQNTAVRIDLSPALVFAPGPLGAAGTSTADWILSSFTASNQITLYVVATNHGPATVEASVTSTTPDLHLESNQQHADLVILPPPIFFMDDTAVLEGASYDSPGLVAWLSRPAPTNLQASFTIELLTAQTEDFTAMGRTFDFAPGSQRAGAYWLVAGDSVPEADETARLSFSSTNLVLSRSSSLLTILNDDLPQASVLSGQFYEGHSGYSNANVTFKLSAKPLFPVDLLFQTSPGTATVMEDYLPRQGWLHFDALEDTKIVPIPFIGDRLYESNETFHVTFANASGAKFTSTPFLVTIRNDDLPPAPIVFISRTSSGAARLGFDSIPGATYQVQTRTNLAASSWSTLTNSAIGTGGAMSFTLQPATNRAAYYRLLAR